MKENKPAPNLPVIRANRHDIDCIFGLFAGIQEWENAGQTMERRVRVIPNGWRDYKLLLHLMDRLTVSLVSTLPTEKLVSVKRMLPRMQYKVICGSQACETRKDECIVAMDDLDTLADAAHEQCKLCVEQNCNRCHLGKTLDRLLTYDRDGRSWANVDFARLREE